MKVQLKPNSINPRITKKERGMIKGAVRRVFSRSELRRAILLHAKVEHRDPARPRVKTWYQCPQCKGHYAQYQMQVDHIEPIIKIQETLEDLSWDTLINRVWCDKNNLVAICIPCHNIKSKCENKQRRQYKKEGQQVSKAYNNIKKSKKNFKQLKNNGPKKYPQHTKLLKGKKSHE